MGFYAVNVGVTFKMTDNSYGGATYAYIPRKLFALCVVSVRVIFKRHVAGFCAVSDVRRIAYDDSYYSSATYEHFAFRKDNEMNTLSR